MLRKQDIAKDLAKRFGIPIKDMREYVEATFKAMEDELVRGGDVMVYGFFAMSSKTCMGRNLHQLVTGKGYSAQEYRKLTCRFATGIRNEVKKRN